VAPLNEALAAALILRTGWDGTTPLVDPMCGSGTFLVESCWLATQRPPGLTRKRFGFQTWLDYDIKIWNDLRDAARRGVRSSLAAPVLGFDHRRDVLELAEKNIRAAGVGHLVKLQTADVRHFAPPTPQGTLICNPPYGERIGEEKDLIPLYQSMGKVFRERCRGWQVYVFSGNPRLGDALELKPTEEIPFWNGKIACRLLHFDRT
jgi:putative N6-adenine-specific DNA methylase